MKAIKILIASLIVAVLVIVFWIASIDKTPVQIPVPSEDEDGLGIAGPNVPFDMWFQAHTKANNLTDAGGCYATSTTGTMVTGTLRDYNCIRISATGAGQGTIALTMPATSTLDFLQNTGDCKAYWIDADAVAAATTTTITAGTGWNIVGLDATGAGTGADVIDGDEFGKMVVCRQSTTDVVGYVEEWIHAD